MSPRTIAETVIYARRRTCGHVTTLPARLARQAALLIDEMELLLGGTECVLREAHDLLNRLPRDGLGRHGRGPFVRWLRGASNPEFVITWEGCLTVLRAGYGSTVVQAVCSLARKYVQPSTWLCRSASSASVYRPWVTSR